MSGFLFLLILGVSLVTIVGQIMLIRENNKLIKRMEKNLDRD